MPQSAMFIAIPVGMNYRTERLSLVTLSLIGFNTVIWLIAAICYYNTDGDSDFWYLRHWWLVPSNCTWYAPFTSMFVHANILHLLGNMIFLFLFGSCVEDMIGRLRFTVFYLVGGLIAEFFYIAMSPAHFHSSIPMGGASGAISACMGMYLLLRADADIEFKYFLWFGYIRAGEFEIPAWLAISFWFVRDLFYMFIDMGGGVAFGAHVGGFLGGVGLVAAYRYLVRRHEESQAEEDSLIIDPAVILRPAATPRAAVAFTSEVPTIFLHDGEQQSGPFTLSHVQAMLHRGEIGRHANYWSDGMAKWESVVDLAGQPIE